MHEGQSLAPLLTVWLQLAVHTVSSCGKEVSRISEGFYISNLVFTAGSYSSLDYAILTDGRLELSSGDGAAVKQSSDQEPSGGDSYTTPSTRSK